MPAYLTNLPRLASVPSFAAMGILFAILIGCERGASDLTSEITAEIAGVTKTDSDGKITEVDFRGTDVSDDDLLMIASLPSIRVVRISGKNAKADITDVGIAALANLTKLKVLALDYLPISESNIQTLSPLRQLRELLLAKTDVNDAALKLIAGFPELTKLRIAGTPITDAGFGHLNQLSKLRSLDVSECQALSDASTDTIVQMKNLTDLNLWRVPITDAGLQSIVNLPNLRSLNLDNTEITDEGLALIANLTDLTFLHLGSTRITDDGLMQLRPLAQLERLIVTRTDVTVGGVAELRKVLPDTDIQWNYEAN